MTQMKIPKKNYSELCTPASYKANKEKNKGHNLIDKTVSDDSEIDSNEDELEKMKDGI